jgi:ABC-type nitrate/sulfonate/bicarbonate transport system substrate-binding protein
MKETLFRWNTGLTRRTLLRNSALGAALGSFALSPFAGSAAWAANNNIKTVLSWLPDSHSSGIWAALDQGYFEEGGVKVDWLPGGPNTPNAVERVASGEVDYGEQANPRPVLEAVARENDFVVVGSTFQRQPGGLLSLSENPIRSVEDIVGKRIICPNPTDARTVEVTLKIAGLPAEFKYVPGGYDPQVLRDDQGDAMVAYATYQPIILEGKGMVAERDYFFRTWDDLGQIGYNNILFTKRDWLEQNRKTMVEYLRAEIRGWKYAENNMDHVISLVVDTYAADFGLDPKIERRALELIIPFLYSEDTKKHGMFWIDKKRLGGSIYDALKLGGLENLPDPDDFVDMSLLEEVHSG